MSDEQIESGNFEFQGTPSERNHNATNSQFSGTATAVTAQSDRLEQPATNRPGRASHEGILPSPTHEDLDTIVDNAEEKELLKQQPPRTCLSPWNASPISRLRPERRLSSPTLPRSLPLIERLSNADLLQVRLLDPLPIPLLDRVAGRHKETTRGEMTSESTKPLLLEKKRSQTELSVISSSDQPSKKMRRTETTPDLKDNGWVNQICCGMDQQDGVDLLTKLRAAHALANSSSFMGKIFPGVNSLSEQPNTPPKEYRPPNGSGSFEENPSTLITSSLQLSALRLMRIRRRSLERHLLLSTRVKRRGKSGVQPTGQRLGDGPQRQSSLLFLIEGKSWSNTRCTSRLNLTPDNHTRTKESSPMTLPSEISLAEDKCSYSPTMINSPTYI